MIIARMSQSLPLLCNRRHSIRQLENRTGQTSYMQQLQHNGLICVVRLQSRHVVRSLVL
jgi:DNA-binding IclR family transcriptional regulator